MSGCGNCCGSCGSCGEMVLSPGEVEMLQKLGQIPFLPVARKADDMTPIYLEDTQHTREEYSLILACLEKKGLIDLDYRQSLAGFDYSAYAGYPCRGSFALTQRGQSVLEMLELQGFGVES